MADRRKPRRNKPLATELARKFSRRMMFLLAVGIGAGVLMLLLYAYP